MANFLTSLRILATPAFIVVMAFSNAHPGLRWVAFLIFGFAAWTDWADGFVARHTDSVSEIGKTLDPLADRLFIGASIITLYAMRILPLLFMVVVVGRDVLMALGYPLVGKVDKSKIAVHWTGKVATAVLFAVLLLLILTKAPHSGSYWSFQGYAFSHPTNVQFYGLWLFVVGMGWSITSAVVYGKRVIELVRERPAAEEGAA
jgi:cardiolipin synthase